MGQVDRQGNKELVDDYTCTYRCRVPLQSVSLCAIPAKQVTTQYIINRVHRETRPCDHDIWLIMCVLQPCLEHVVIGEPQLWVSERVIHLLWGKVDDTFAHKAGRGERGREREGGEREGREREMGEGDKGRKRREREKEGKKGRGGGGGRERGRERKGRGREEGRRGLDKHTYSTTQIHNYVHGAQCSSYSHLWNGESADFFFSIITSFSTSTKLCGQE